MSAVENLRTLAAGHRPASGLLHTARLEAFGVESYGEEAIVEAFRHGTTDLSDAATIVEAPGHIAIFDNGVALVADLYGTAVGRIWRLGGGDPRTPEPAIRVAFDPDLTQARGDVFMALSDHPALDADAAVTALSAGQAIAREDAASYRTRAFAVRAFGTARHGAALFAVYRIAGDDTDHRAREAGFAMAAAHWTQGVLHIVRDSAGERTTPPQFRAAF